MHFIYWFRKDLRLKDNHALSEFIKAVNKENSYSFIYIKNDNSYYYFGRKRISFLYDCLSELKNELKTFSFDLQIINGKSKDVFSELINQFKEISLYFNQQIEPYCISRDMEVKEIVENNGGSCRIYTDTTLFQPGEILNNEGKHFKVYTPFKNSSLQNLKESHYRMKAVDFEGLSKDRHLLISNGIKDFAIPGNSENENIHKGGRQEGLRLFKDFYENHLCKYKSARDFPSVKGTSMLSAHLHFGTLSIRELFRASLNKLSECKNEEDKTEVQTWINELLWREFYYHITFHNPRIMFESFKKDYDNLLWEYDEDKFNKWCNGLTGYPIVDAGMRQLNSEGWMHNRLRMITAMFLTKDLFTDWRFGEKYFAENLIDMDFSNNNGGWQWSASTGVDAQPYFRIFNPYLQSKKFDPEGEYIKKYVPELKSLPPEFIHEPNIMNEEEQKKYNVKLGEDYPYPIVDHREAKELVLKKFKRLTEYI